MSFFVQQSPIVLTDKLFELYGGTIANSSQGQRQAAYTIAEEAVQSDLGTFLLPTVVTGTYEYRSEIELDHAFVRSVRMAWITGFDERIVLTISGTGNQYMSLQDGDYGIVDMGMACYVAGYYETPYQAHIVYEAGFPSGTTYTPNMLLALTTVAQLELNEIIGYGNEAPGDMGVKEYSNQEYSEKRVAMFQTAMGTSAKAQFAHRLLSKYRRYRKVGMGRPIR